MHAPTQRTPPESFGGGGVGGDSTLAGGGCSLSIEAQSWGGKVQYDPLG